MADFRFVDLFAGIGGFRLGFEMAGGKCVFTSEINAQARKVYAVNHGEPESGIAGDIAMIKPDQIPEHDVLLAGFPCQAFSTQGHRDGFDDTRGTMFFEIARILAAGRTRALCLENVPNLLRHDNGNTFAVMARVLRDLGFHISLQVINAAAWVPQRRKRMFLCGHRDNRGFNIDFMPVPDPSTGPTLGTILDRDPKHDELTLTDTFMRHLEHENRTRGNIAHICGDGDVGGTLIAQYQGSAGSTAVLVKQPGRNPRRLSARECARYMGFPDTFQIPVSRSAAYRLFGNAIVPQVAGHIATHLKAEI